MKLLARTLTFWRICRQSFSSSLLLWVGAIVVLELVGPHLKSDLLDSLALLGLLALAAVTWVMHRQERIPWVAACTRLSHRIRTRWLSVQTQFGADFRGKPHIPSGVPGVLWKPAIALTAVTLALVGFHDAFPDPARDLLIRGSYSLYLLCLGSVWAACLGLIFVMLFLLHGQIHDWSVTRYQGQGPRPMRHEGVLHVVAFGTLVVLSLVASFWVSVALVTMGSAVILLVLIGPRHPELRLLWQNRCANRPIRSIELRPFLAFQYVLFLLTYVSLLFLTRGTRLFGPTITETTMPITQFASIALSWTAAAGSWVMALRLVRLIQLKRHHDPARPIQRTIHMSGVDDSVLQSRIREELDPFKWAVRFEPEPRKTTEVPLKMVDAGQAQEEWSLESQWPLAVSLKDLVSSQQLWRYHRRWETQCRRLLFRGLQKLFKRTARSKRSDGEGYWIGLQHWFVMGLSRDQDEDNPNLEEDGIIEHIIGPPFHQVFDRQVRHHFLQVMSALELDLIFIEDGLEYRRFRPAFETLFEIFDRHGGGERAEERHFAGIANLSVIIHEFDLDHPFRTEKYPEPTYEDIGRARILHIFRDRGGEEKPVLDPADLSWVPVGSA